MARRIDWTGVFVPAVTPFDKDGNLLEDSLRKVCDHLIADGADGIIIAGCTGEWFSMSDTERRRVFAVAKEHVGKRAKMIAGTCAIATHEAKALTKAAKDMGYDGCMIMAPHFIAPSNSEIVGHYADIAKAGLPIMIYNHPAKGHHNLDADLIEQLKPIDMVVAIKDSAVDMPQMISVVNRHHDWLAIFPGREGYAEAMIERGAAGITVMMQNVVGRHCVDWYKHLAAGRFKESQTARQLIDDAYQICLSKSVKPSRPTGHWSMIKACMNIMGRDGGYMRRPYTPLPDSDLPMLERALVAAGLMGNRARAAAE